MSCNGCKAKDVGACTAHGGTGWDPRAGPHPCPEAVKIKRYGALDDSSYARVCPHCGKSEADIIDSEQFQAQARLLREPCAAVIGRDRRKQRLPLIGADVLQATSGIQGAATAIQGTVFADTEPFDPKKAVTDIVGS